MQKKEYYKHNLPHFQQSGQAYFVTWSLKYAVPKHKLKHFSKKLELLKSQLSPGLANSNSRLNNRGTDTVKSKGNGKLLNLGLAGFKSPLEESRNGIRETLEAEKPEKEYNLLRKRYLKAYNELLDVERKPKIDLSKPEHTKIIIETLKYWQDKKLKNHAFCVMPNHVHWVVEVLEKDDEGNLVYLQDIMYSVKRFTATQINKLENRSGALWQKESFDTSIRDRTHLHYTIEYTLNNPVNAGLVKHWKGWEGCWCAE